MHGNCCNFANVDYCLNGAVGFVFRQLLFFLYKQFFFTEVTLGFLFMNMFDLIKITFFSLLLM